MTLKRRTAATVVEEGKQRTSQNALKHGLYATDPLIRGEDPDDFYQHGAELEYQLRPANAVEEDLVGTSRDRHLNCTPTAFSV